MVCLYTDGLAEARTEHGILGRPRLADIVEELGRGATAAGLLDAVAAEARLVSDDMATLVLSPTAGVTSGAFAPNSWRSTPTRRRTDWRSASSRPAGSKTDRLREASAEARALAGGYGGAVLYVRFGVPHAQVEVLPRNVTTLEAASRLRAVPRRGSA
ncbi:MAG: SpoIIE family protein phosphatase [Thermoleophilaceae bacterium]